MSAKSPAREGLRDGGEVRRRGRKCTGSVLCHPFVRTAAGGVRVAILRNRKRLQFRVADLWQAQRGAAQALAEGRPATQRQEAFDEHSRTIKVYRTLPKTPPGAVKNQRARATT